MAGKPLLRNFVINERAKNVEIRTMITQEDRELTEKRTVSYDKIKELYAEILRGLDKYRIDLGTLKKKLLDKPPAVYNLEPRLIQLKEDLQKIAKEQEANQKIREWEGLKEQVEVIERSIKEMEEDEKQIKQLFPLPDKK